MHNVFMKPILTAGALALLATAAFAQQTEVSDPQTEALLSRFSDDANQFTQTDGEALYRTTCQACHMADGQGDEGAGAYPPLSDDNPKMNSRHYIAGVILTGYHGMPRFGDTMTDAQIAAVTNYVRNSFGNNYSRQMTAEEVTALRAPD